MALTFKLNTFDADLLTRTLRALVVGTEACDQVLYAAGLEPSVHKEAVEKLIRIAGYLETVDKAGS